MPEYPHLGLQDEQKRALPEKKQYPVKTKVTVKVYLSYDDFEKYASRATAAGFRRGGLPLFIKKPHGFENERLANTDGISKYLKDCAEKVAAAEELARVLKVLVNKR